MTVAVVIRNKNSVIQIDGNYSNFGLVSKQTITPSANANPNGLFYTPFSVTGGETPAIGTAPASTSAQNQIAIFSVSRSGSTFNYMLMTSNRNPVEIYHFDKMRLSSKYPTNVGIIIRNRVTGEVVFDSRCRYMRVIDFIAGSRPTGQGFDTVVRNYPAMKLGTIQTSVWLESYSEALPGPPPPMVLAGVSISCSVVGPSSVTLVGSALAVVGPAIGVVDYNLFNNAYSYLVINLTGM